MLVRVAEPENEGELLELAGVLSVSQLTRAVAAFRQLAREEAAGKQRQEFFAYQCTAAGIRSAIIRRRMIGTEISRLHRLERGELVLDTGRTYDGIEPVYVRVSKRAGRYEFSDDGGAVAAAAVDVRDVAFPASIALGRHSVNVSRVGVVWLPATGRATEEWLGRLPGLVAEGSVALYEALLDSDG